MSKKRNIVEEIELKKIRSNYASKYGCFERYWDIADFLEKNEENKYRNDKEVLRYIPLASIAATETYFRLLYKEILDKGEPYFSNAIKYFKDQGNVKFDLEFLIAIQGKQVTAGEIFSHLMPLNNLADINTALTKILGIDFLASLKKFRYSESSSLAVHSKSFKTNLGNYLNSVSRLFELRHILAHEFALNIDLDKKQIMQDFSNLSIFVRACDFAVSKILGDYMPEYQQGMNIQAQKYYKKTQTELNKLIRQIKRNDPKSEFNQIGNIKLFSKAIKEWENYRELYAQSYAEMYKGGSLAPLIYWSEMENLTKQMIQNLRDSFSLLLKQNIS